MPPKDKAKERKSVGRVNKLTIADLPEEERSKVSRLVEKLVSLGTEHQTAIDKLALVEKQYVEDRAASEKRFGDESASNAGDIQRLNEVVGALEQQRSSAFELLGKYQTRLQQMGETLKEREKDEISGERKAALLSNLSSLEDIVANQKMMIESFQNERASVEEAHKLALSINKEALDRKDAEAERNTHVVSKAEKRVSAIETACSRLTKQITDMHRKDSVKQAEIDALKRLLTERTTILAATASNVPSKEDFSLEHEHASASSGHANTLSPNSVRAAISEEVKKQVSASQSRATSQHQYQQHQQQQNGKNNHNHNNNNNGDNSHRTPPRAASPHSSTPLRTGSGSKNSSYGRPLHSHNTSPKSKLSDALRTSQEIKSGTYDPNAAEKERAREKRSREEHAARLEQLAKPTKPHSRVSVSTASVGVGQSPNPDFGQARSLGFTSYHAANHANGDHDHNSHGNNGNSNNMHISSGGSVGTAKSSGSKARLTRRSKVEPSRSGRHSHVSRDAYDGGRDLDQRGERGFRDRGEKDNNSKIGFGRREKSVKSAFPERGGGSISTGRDKHDNLKEKGGGVTKAKSTTTRAKLDLDVDLGEKRMYDPTLLDLLKSIEQ